MTAAQRVALREHIRAIEEYEVKRANQEERLWAPFKSRFQDLWELSHTPVTSPTAQGAFLGRGFTEEEHREAMMVHQQVEAGLAAFDREHRPKVEPFDTPAKIIASIEEKEFNWSAERWPLLAMSGIEVSDREKREHDDDKARDAYREARGRALRLIKFDAQVHDQLPERSDPVLGLQDVRAWADCMLFEVAKSTGRDESSREFRVALHRLIGAIHDAPPGREFGDWTKPLILALARAAHDLGFPAPIIYQDYVDMVQKAAGEDTAITFVRYGAPESSSSQTLVLQGYRRENDRWIATGPVGLDERWRQDVLQVLRMWLRYTDPSPLDDRLTVKASSSGVNTVSSGAAEQADQPGSEYNGSMSFDVFISHASEDKDGIVRELASRLKGLGYAVWYDEYVLKLGDSLRQSIDNGLSKCRFGIVILSHDFFAKNWPQRELNALNARETTDGQKRILPVWHNVGAKEIASYSPMLADRLGASSSQGLEQVVKQIVDVLGPPASLAVDLSSGSSAPSAEVPDNMRQSGAKPQDPNPTTPRNWRKELRAALRAFNIELAAIRADTESRPPDSAELHTACSRVATALEPLLIAGLQAIQFDPGNAEIVARVSADMLDHPEWNKAGFKSHADLVNVGPFIFHHVLGTCCMEEDWHDAAIQLLVEHVPDETTSQWQDLWRTYPLMGCGPAFQNNCYTSWSFLEDLHDALGVVREAIPDKGDYVNALKTYVCLASALELAQFVSLGGDSSKFDEHLMPDVHPVFLKDIRDGAEANRIVRRAIPSARVTEQIAARYSASPGRVRMLWPNWVRFLIDRRLRDPRRPGFRADFLFLGTAPVQLP